MDSPVMSAAYRVVDEIGAVQRSGYRFRIFLPGKSGSVTERASPQRSMPPATGDCCAGPRPRARAPVGVSGPIDTDAAERRWYCYAWPIEPGETGSRSFWIDQDGDLWTTAEGRDGPPAAPPARDGRLWRLMP